jgi:hypothetical protein
MLTKPLRMATANTPRRSGVAATGVIRGGDHAVVWSNLAVGSDGKAPMAAATPSMRWRGHPSDPERLLARPVRTAVRRPQESCKNLQRPVRPRPPVGIAAEVRGDPKAEPDRPRSTGGDVSALLVHELPQRCEVDRLVVGSLQQRDQLLDEVSGKPQQVQGFQDPLAEPSKVVLARCWSHQGFPSVRRARGPTPTF